MKIRNQKDFWAGVMFIAFGLFFAVVGVQYRYGTSAKMGPGYFPTILGVIVIVLGIIITAQGLFSKISENKLSEFSWNKLLLILGSVLLFGVLLQPLGLIISLVVLITVSSYASDEFKWKATLFNAFVLIIICMIIFLWWLKIDFNLWPSFIVA